MRASKASTIAARSRANLETLAVGIVICISCLVTAVTLSRSEPFNCCA